MQSFRKVANLFYDVLSKPIRFAWNKLKQLCLLVFYKQIEYMGRHHGIPYSSITNAYMLLLAFVLVPFWLVPWVFLIVQHIVSVWGCEYSISAPYLGTICLPDPVIRTHWFLPLWDRQADAADYVDIIHPSVEAILIGHLAIGDMEVELLGQGSKLHQLAGGDPVVKELISNLGILILLQWLLWMSGTN